MSIVMLLFMFCVTYSYAIVTTFRDYFRDRKGLKRCDKEYVRLKKKLDELENPCIEDNDFKEWEDLYNACDIYYRKMDIVMDQIDMYYKGLHMSRIEILKSIAATLGIILIVLLMLEWRYL